MVYDPDTQRVVLVYSNTDGSYYAYIVVGQASATGVTWGTPVTVYSGAVVGDIACCYDTTNDRVGVAYERAGGGGWYAAYSINGGTNTPTSIASHVQFSTGGESCGRNTLTSILLPLVSQIRSSRALNAP
jgi:hypothetical protein